MTEKPPGAECDAGPGERRHRPNWLAPNSALSKGAEVLGCRGAPRLLSSAKRGDNVYWDAVADWPVNVDVVVREPDEPIGNWITLGVLATHRVLYGDGATLGEAKIAMAVPTYAEARKIIIVADHHLEDARGATDDFFQDRYYRTAFSALFDAARSAAMTLRAETSSSSVETPQGEAYLAVRLSAHDEATEETRWGELRRGLPKPFSGQFREIVNVLHIAYSYRGDYPRQDAEGEFRRWRERVGRFMEALERERQSR